MMCSMEEAEELVAGRGWLLSLAVARQYGQEGYRTVCRKSGVFAVNRAWECLR